MTNKYRCLHGKRSCIIQRCSPLGNENGRPIAARVSLPGNRNLPLYSRICKSGLPSIFISGGEVLPHCQDKKQGGETRHGHLISV